MSKKKKKKIYYKGKAYEEPYTGGRFSNDELSLIANTFYDNVELVMALRKHFLQGNMLAVEMIDLEKFAQNQEAMSVLRKMLIPYIDPEVPLFQTADLWVSLDTLFKEHTYEQAIILMEARQIMIDYLEQQFMELADRETPQRIKLKDLIPNPRKKPREAFVELSARNYLITFIDRHLQELVILASQNKHLRENAESQEQKQKMDSSK